MLVWLDTAAAILGSLASASASAVIYAARAVGATRDSVVVQSKYSQMQLGQDWFAEIDRYWDQLYLREPALDDNGREFVHGQILSLFEIVAYHINKRLLDAKVCAYLRDHVLEVYGRLRAGNQCFLDKYRSSHTTFEELEQLLFDHKVVALAAITRSEDNELG